MGISPHVCVVQRPPEFGKGTSTNIRDAYTFICHNYLGDGDEIILIGFSRRAFTVRCIAAFIHDVGLLTRTGLKYLDSVYRQWKTKISDSRFLGTSEH